MQLKLIMLKLCNIKVKFLKNLKTLFFEQKTSLKKS